MGSEDETSPYRSDAAGPRRPREHLGCQRPYGAVLGSRERPPGHNVLFYRKGNGHAAALLLLFDKAAERGHEAIVAMLLGWGADPETSPALSQAAREGHEGVVKLLLKCGADLIACQDGGEALTEGAKSAQPSVVEMLLWALAALSPADPRSVAHATAGNGGRGRQSSGGTEAAGKRG